MDGDGSVRVIKAKCSEDTATLKEYIEQDRVYDFLVGLKPEYDQVRVQIFGQKTVPNINEVVATMRSEESRRGLMLADPPIVESSAMLVEKNSIVTAADQKKGEGTYVVKKGEELFCTFCKKYHHTREKCWRLNGKPPSREWDKKGDLSKKGGQAHMAAGANEASQKNAKPLNQDEVEQMRSFLGRLEKPIGTSSLAYSGTFPSFFGEFPFSFGLNASDIPLKHTGY